MDRKQKHMLVSILIVLLLISLLIGYTFAKYYSAYNGQGTLEAAKWSFKVNGWSTSETTKISLSDTNSQVTLEDGKMAPGFDGRVELELDATDSEVDVEYSIEAEEEGHKPSNMVFKAISDGSETKTYDTLKELAENELNGTILKSDTSKIKSITICCVWPYETGDTDAEIEVEDAEDTAVGTGTVVGQEDVYDYTFSLKVVGTQAKTTT